VLRLLSHLDLQRLAARVFRRAGVQVKMSGGFHPQPRISYGPALPLGVAGENEYLDAIIFSDASPTELLSRLNQVSPAGLRFAEAAVIEKGVPSLSAEIAAALYRITRCDGGKFDRRPIDEFLSRDQMEWVRVRPDKPEQRFDLRAAVKSMEIDRSGRVLRLMLALTNGPQARPSEAAAAVFSLDYSEIEVIREQLFLQREGGYRLPIESER
jgi:radical SAM-linked protein